MAGKKEDSSLKKKIELAAAIVGFIGTIIGGVIAVETRYETSTASKKADEDMHVKAKAHTDVMVKQSNDEIADEIKYLTKNVLEAKLDNTNLEIQIMKGKPEFTWTTMEKQQFEFLERKRIHLEEALGY